jgi:hypothetical protein
VIGVFPTGSLAPIGGDFPVIVPNPNFHLLCEVPGTCVFSGGNYQLANLPNNDLVEQFLALNGLPVPTDYQVDSSNLLVEGVTFSGVFGNVSTIVSFQGRGNNMKFSNCLFTAQDSANPPQTAFSITYNAETGIKQGEELYSSVILEDSAIENNDFFFTIFGSFWVGDSPNKVVSSIDLIRTSIRNNRIPGFALDGTAFNNSIFISGYFQSWSFHDSQMVDNIIGRSAANIRLLDGEIAAFENSVINNVITEDLNPDCTDVLLVSTELTYIPPGCGQNGTSCPSLPLDVVGCLELSAMPPSSNPAPSPLISYPTVGYPVSENYGGGEKHMGKGMGTKKEMGKKKKEMGKKEMSYDKGMGSKKGGRRHLSTEPTRNRVRGQVTL